MPTSSSSSSSISTSTATATSSFQQTVSLHDWWLIKAEHDFQGKTIAVAGLTSPEKKPVRVFHSAAITKRYDVFTLETADGVTVLIQGYINRKLTVENGFSSEVFRHFCFGFPPDWEECATKFLNSNCKNMAEPPVSQNESHPSFSARPLDDGVSNLKNDASKNLSPLSTCHVNAVSSIEDCVAVPAEPSSHHLAPSSEKIDVLEGSKKSKRRSFGKSMAKRSVSLERIGIKNVASGEYFVLADSNAPAAYPVHTDYDEDTTSTIDQIPSVGTSGVVLAITLKEFKSAKKKQKENKGNKDGLKSRSYLSACSLPQIPKAMLTCIDDDTTQGTTLGDSSILNQSANCLVETSVFSSMQLGAAANIITPSTVETDAVSASLSDSGCGKSSTSLTNLIKIQKQKSVSGRSAKYKAKELISDEVKLNRNSGTTICSSDKVNIAEAMQRASRMLKEPSGNSISKEKKETTAVEKGGSSTKQARRKVIFEADIRKVETCIRSSESLSLKRSRSGRQLLPPLDFWRNQIPVYDKNRNITGVKEELGALDPSKGLNLKLRGEKQKAHLSK